MQLWVFKTIWGPFWQCGSPPQLRGLGAASTPPILANLNVNTCFSFLICMHDHYPNFQFRKKMETIPNNLGFEFHRSNKLRAWIYTSSQGMLWNGK